MEKIKLRAKDKKISLKEIEEIVRECGYWMSDREKKLFVDAYHTKADDLNEDAIMVGVEKFIERDKTS